MLYTIDELRRLHASRVLENPNKCVICKKPFTMADEQEGTQKVQGGEAHQDCYFDELGDFIEKNPIGRIGRR